MMHFASKNFDLIKCGVIVDTGIGDIHTLIKNQKTLEKRGSRRVSPLTIPKTIGNMASILFPLKLAFKM